MELSVHLPHTETCGAKVCRIKLGRGFREKGVVKEEAYSVVCLEYVAFRSLFLSLLDMVSIM